MFSTLVHHKLGVEHVSNVVVGHLLPSGPDSTRALWNKGLLTTVMETLSSAALVKVTGTNCSGEEMIQQA